MPFGELQTCFQEPRSVECTAHRALWTDRLASSVELSSSFRVTFGVFAASLTNALLIWPVSFGGQPSQG